MENNEFSLGNFFAIIIMGAFLSGLALYANTVLFDRLTITTLAASFVVVNLTLGAVALVLWAGAKIIDMVMK